MLKLGVYKNGWKYTAAVYAQSARSCSLRLFDSSSEEPKAVIPMHEDPVYSYIYTCDFDIDAAEYDFETDLGVLNDPYAMRMCGDETFGFDRRYSRAAIPSGRRGFKDFARERTEYSDLIIYKLHVRGFTIHPSSGAKNGGTFRALAQKLDYIGSMGFNAILLMPCYDFCEVMPSTYGQPARLNFWGYGAEASYFAPKTSYASDKKRVCEEFAAMVYAAHSKGIEVLMEMDFAADMPDIMMLEALRFWHEVYHVDGFRLMNSSVSAKLMATDPYMKSVKLIGESWSEELSVDPVKRARPVLAGCSDDYMIAVRSFLIGREGGVKDFAHKISDNGNSSARVNYVADHNGFTLADVYSYDVRHNEANNEKNQDGREINYSWNCGVEGPTANRGIGRLRMKMLKNALAVLFMSQGTPLLMAGDEFGNTHYGNNNPYCCDNEQGWVVWQKNAAASEIRRFTKEMTSLRRAHRIFSNIITLRGSDYIHSGCPDVSFHGTKAWYPDYGYYSRTLGMLLNGEYAITNHVKRDTSFYVTFNMHWEAHEFDLPTINNKGFRLVLSTDRSNTYDGGRTCVMAPRSICIFAVEKCEGPIRQTRG